MKRIAWLTDIHLNFLENAEIDALARRIAAEQPDAVLLSGDISEAPSLEAHLTALAGPIASPIFFVLGNHDFYRSSIDAVRENARSLSATTRSLRWLPAEGVVRISENTALVGHDGWGDGRLGSRDSPVVLSDFFLIRDLFGLSARRLFDRLASLGDETAAYFREHVPRALDECEDVLVLTHVPPFREACWHEGAVSNDDWLPFFTCAAAGDALAAIMRERPDRRMTVLCGHTHSSGRVRILPNLEVRTGAAEYGAPDLQEMLLVE